MSQPKIERRRYPRLEVPVLFRTPKKEDDLAPTMNLGLGGVRIYSNRYLQKDKRQEIVLCFPEGNTFSATVQVVWTKILPPGSAAVFDVGLEFVDLPTEAIDVLKEVLETD